MNVFVVCLDSYWVRDTQMFDARGLSEDELDNLDMCSEANLDRWHDTDPCPFVGIVTAASEAEACKKAGAEHGYDPRSLFGIIVTFPGGAEK